MNLRAALITSTMLLVTSAAIAQTPAPVPTQLATVRTIFLASGAAPGGGHETAIAQIVYSSTYHALSAAGRYHLAGTPAEAELSMIVSTQSSSNVFNGDSIGGPFIRLEIYDIKTHTLLWALDEPVNGAFREKTFQKNVGESIAKLMDDLKTLASGTIPGDLTTNPKPEPTKTHLSDEGKK